MRKSRLILYKKFYILEKMKKALILANKKLYISDSVFPFCSTTPSYFTLFSYLIPLLFFFIPAQAEKLSQKSENSNQARITKTVPNDSFNKSKEILSKNSNLSETSNKNELLTNNNPSKDFSNIEFLNHFFKSNSAVKIHNQSLELLKNKNEKQAILLLKKNFYQNLFAPSYFALNHLKESVSFFPLFLIISSIITSLIAFIFFILYLKSFSFSHLKIFLSSLFVFACLLGVHLFVLKEKVSPLTEIHLKLAPVESAPNTVPLSSLKELTVLKKKGKWLKVKDSQKQTGWIQKQQVFQTL